MSTTRLRRALARDPSLRTHDQARIALFLAQLDGQLRHLEKNVAGLGVVALERQPGPGRNSVGMLLAHIAVTEVFWIGVASGRATDPEAADPHCKDVLGITLSDDGMPLAAGGGHAASLAGWDLARYLDVVRRARAFLRTHVSAWSDGDLDGFVRYRDNEYTREWVLHHLSEHLAYHAGQIGLLMAMAKDTN